MTRLAAPSRATIGPLAILLVSFAAFVSLGLPDGLLGVAWPSIRDLFVRSQADFGLILLAHGVAYFFSGLCAARLIAPFGTAKVLIASAALVTGGLLTFATAHSWWVILAAAAIVATGSGLLNTAINSYAARHFSARHVNWLHASYSLGASVGPLAMTAVLANGGEWRAGYLVIAAVPVLMGFVYMSTAQGWQAAPAVISSTTRLSAVSSIALTQVLMFFCYSGLELFFGRWCFTVLTELHGVSLELAGLATSCYFGSVFAGRLLLGALLDRVGADRMIRIGTGGVLFGGLLFTIGSPSVAIGALLVIGFSLAPIFPTMIARTGSRFAASQVPSVIAASVAAAILGSSAVPYLSGVVAANFGLSTMLFIPLGVACALMASHETILRLHARQL